MEKIKLLLYCTKQSLFLVRNECDGYFYTMDKRTLNDYKNVETYNGKIVAECDYDVEEIPYDCAFGYFKMWHSKLKQTCLTMKELEDYLQKKKGYAIHIKNLNIFDKPRELNEFYNSKDYYKTWQPIKNAPQNMMYADYINIEKNMFRPYILISIRPEWLCKILNGEKTIEVRKKILKEMMQDA